MADPTVPATRLLRATDQELLAQCEMDMIRGSGPGGQKRNKTSNAIRLRHRPTGIAVQAGDTRSQQTNRNKALARLKMALALQLRGELDAAAPPSEVVQLVQRKLGQRNPRYPLAVAQLLDLLSNHDLSLREAGQVMGVSTAALSRVLVADTQLLQHFNRQRAARGLRPISGS